MLTLILNCITILLFPLLLLVLWRLTHLANKMLRIDTQVSSMQQQGHQYEQIIFQLSNDLRDRHDLFRETLIKHFQELQTLFNSHQVDNLQILHKNLHEVRSQVVEALNSNVKTMVEQIEKLIQTIETRLKEISGQVEQRLSEGFEKTTATFTDIIKRLALIDEAQKKITELSTNVVSLQEILTDKRSRGAFGEVQLSALIRNMLPENAFAFQYSLPEGKRADCILFLPEPTGHVVIDAKFPLESYQRMLDMNAADSDRQTAKQQFKQDIRKHIQDIATKYIIPGTTADGALMFIPAEAIFAEIHAYYPDLVEMAQKDHVWMVSPTTMMAIITTARAVIKDDATRKQVHIIQEHLRQLAKNFELFRGRMDKLALHIKQANSDVEDIHTSAKKITSQFTKIEKVELSAVEQLTELDNECRVD